MSPARVGPNPFLIEVGLEGHAQAGEGVDRLTDGDHIPVVTSRSFRFAFPDEP